MARRDRRPVWLNGIDAGRVRGAIDVMITRRTIVAGVLMVPAAAFAARVSRFAHGAILASRPGSSGRSAALCGACGSTSHTMLDRGCPAAPKVV